MSALSPSSAPSSSSSPTAPGTCSLPGLARPVPTFTREEVARHNQRHDCWTIVNDHVYDVTNYLSLHPGGVRLLFKNAGGDSTADFVAIRHSKKATAILDAYWVGQLAGKRPLRHVPPNWGSALQRTNSLGVEPHAAKPPSQSMTMVSPAPSPANSSSAVDASRVLVDASSVSARGSQAVTATVSRPSSQDASPESSVSSGFRILLVPPSAHEQDDVPVPVAAPLSTQSVGISLSSTGTTAGAAAASTSACVSTAALIDSSLSVATAHLSSSSSSSLSSLLAAPSLLPPPDWHVCRLDRVEQLGASSRLLHFTFLPASSSPWRSSLLVESPFGFHMSIEVPALSSDSTFVRRSYTPLHVRNDGFSLLVKSYGSTAPGSAALHALRVGAQQRFWGPVCTLQPVAQQVRTASTVFMLCMGTGVAPMMSLLQHMLEAAECDGTVAASSTSASPSSTSSSSASSRARTARLLYGSRSADDILLRDELDELCQAARSTAQLDVAVRHQLSRAVSPPTVESAAKRHERTPASTTTTYHTGRIDRRVIIEWLRPFRVSPDSSSSSSSSNAVGASSGSSTHAVADSSLVASFLSCTPAEANAQLFGPAFTFPADSLFLICGTDAFRDDVLSVLASIGVPPDAVHAF